MAVNMNKANNLHDDPNINKKHHFRPIKIQFIVTNKAVWIYKQYHDIQNMVKHRLIKKSKIIRKKDSLHFSVSQCS